uniref:Putative LAGLIDADG homing endonuclease n=2 Tax=Dunaliella TaxID=3044 RepID=A0A1C8XRJ7_DUNSA|nr:putative LAGLIDADG homing endonuclease [Dunaliella tertiolecta]AOH77120.1 putative LAGLIDADG homing endonuclease [Dunaliella salina]AOH77121.1 putative LAGLIDADG homing endonuclease [Dunaliella salina]|mmetsp:Transcript_17210/g.45073  ORF Transcript_17210/g.45073 Transcript_17210/m.45073 type:complete len:235 (+) Transcript_17210:285-989(+)
MNKNLYKVEQKRDTNGICIPKYDNYVIPTLDKTAPASKILNSKQDLSGKKFTVKDAFGRDVVMSADWIAGFTDGEGTLTININKNTTLTYKFQIQPVFIIVQGEADYYLLTAIANFFGCGSVTVNRKDKTSVRYQYRVNNLELLTNIFIPFFDKVSLLTKKKDEYFLWKDLVIEHRNKTNLDSWPNSMVAFLEKAKLWKCLGTQTKQTESYIKTCDKYIEIVKGIPSENIERLK